MSQMRESRLVTWEVSVEVIEALSDLALPWP